VPRFNSGTNQSNYELFGSGLQTETPLLVQSVVMHWNKLMCKIHSGSHQAENDDV
jgi:hypothetical protein